MLLNDAKGSLLTGIIEIQMDKLSEEVQGLLRLVTRNHGEYIDHKDFTEGLTFLNMTQVHNQHTRNATLRLGRDHNKFFKLTKEEKKLNWESKIIRWKKVKVWRFLFVFFFFFEALFLVLVPVKRRRTSRRRQTLHGG